jgi:hypothetical protein
MLSACALSAVTLAGHPSKPLRRRDDASAEELRAENMRLLGVLAEAGVIDLTALPKPKRGTAISRHAS